MIFGFIQASGRTRWRMLVAIPLVTAILAIAVPQISERWAEENPDTQGAVERSMTVLDYGKLSEARYGAVDRIVAYSEKVPLGAGLSRTGAAAGAFADQLMHDPWFPQGFFGDNFWASTIAEIGLPGSLILTALILGILFKGFMGVRRMHDRELAALAAVILCSLAMVVSGLWGAEGLLYNPEAAYFWFFSGLLLRLPAIDEERWRERLAAEAETMAGDEAANMV